MTDVKFYNGKKLKLCENTQFLLIAQKIQILLIYNTIGFHIGEDFVEYRKCEGNKKENGKREIGLKRKRQNLPYAIFMHVGTIQLHMV